MVHQYLLCAVANISDNGWRESRPKLASDSNITQHHASGTQSVPNYAFACHRITRPFTGSHTRTCLCAFAVGCGRLVGWTASRTSILYLFPARMDRSGWYAFLSVHSSDSASLQFGVSIRSCVDRGNYCVAVRPRAQIPSAHRQVFEIRSLSYRHVCCRL